MGDRLERARQAYAVELARVEAWVASERQRLAAGGRGPYRWPLWVIEASAEALRLDGAEEVTRG